jgi:hypothetical protein
MSAAASITIGLTAGCPLHGIPRTSADVTPGHVDLIIGYTPSGRPVTITTTTLEWVDDLIAAAQTLRARGIVQAGMQAVTP